MKKTLLITGLIAGVAFTSSAVAGGSCGDNCTWDLDEDGVLTISGTGDMDWGVSTPPWYNQRSSIKSVQVSNGVTSIGYAAFVNATSLTSINIPEGVTSI